MKKKYKYIGFSLGMLLFFSLNLGQNNSQIEVHNLRSHIHPSFTRIVVDIGALREYHSNQLLSPDRMYVDIYQAKLNPLLHGKTETVNTDYVSQIRIAQKNPTTVRVAVDLNFNKIRNYNVWHLFDPFRIIIDIYPGTPEVKSPDEKTIKPPEPTKSGYSMARQLGLGIRRIVIDPGHGGRDPGCIGKKGSREKNIVLDVALQLKKLLITNTDLEVIMTRESDIYIPVEDRPVIANQKQADIFISIHANSNPKKNHSGVQTFYLNFSSDPSVNEIAARENATSTKNISEMKGIIQKIARNSKIAESKDMASKIQSILSRHLKNLYKDVKNLGVKGGPFWVLIGGEMPSILVEISHLSNPKEESRLITASYRRQVAQGIYAGILEYLNSLGKG